MVVAMTLNQLLRARAACIGALAAATIAMSGCSWLQSVEVDNTRDWTAQKLYAEAREAMRESNWSLAKDYYTKIESRFPFGSYAQQAQVDLAYVYWKDDDPAGALQQIDRFLRAYPNHPISDYALYLKALVTLNERNGFVSQLISQDLADRDPEAARNAFDTFKELAGRFPDSKYAPEARRRMHELVLAQARGALSTAQYYYERHCYVAAINRAKVILTDFQLTPYSDDAMVLIADSYRELGLTDLEADMRRVIEANKNRKSTRRN
ncbi:MAG: outer membrane protein assembly factor BamD [Duodenibacillus sp.]|nr:outer membrane protein assembly factor BamD [Duodenibacillus sp.]